MPWEKAMQLKTLWLGNKNTCLLKFADFMEYTSLSTSESPESRPSSHRSVVELAEFWRFWNVQHKIFIKHRYQI